MESQIKQGLGAERFVKELLEEKGYDVNVDDSWYDLRIRKGKIQKLIEVKSTNFVLKNGNKSSMYGRFDFTEIKNRRLQRKHNVDICFVVCIKKRFELVGFIKARTIRAKRYIPLAYLMTKRKTKTVETYCNFIEK